MWYLLQGLESEEMGLPRDVSSGATCVGFTAAHHCALTIPTMLYHTPTMHGGVKAHARSQRTMGRPPGFLQLGGCSSISITLLLVSQEIPGSVHESLHTQPIHFMGNPLNVWTKTVTAFQGSPRPPAGDVSGYCLAPYFLWFCHTFYG